MKIKFIMKANTLRTIIGLFISGLIISSCSLVKDFDYTVTPNPLEMHGDSVKFTVVVNIPEKGIKKTVKAEITPKLGGTSLGVWTVQGSKITGNGKVIEYKPGGTATFETALAYDPSFEAADLVLTGKVFKKREREIRTSRAKDSGCHYCYSINGKKGIWNALSKRSIGKSCGQKCICCNQF